MIDPKKNNTPTQRVTGGRGLEKKGAFHFILKFTYHRMLKYVITGYTKYFRKDYQIIDRPFSSFDVPVEQIVCKVVSPLMPPLHRSFLNFKIRNVGIIADGDWDLHLVKFSDEKIYNCLQERFVEGREWEATSYFKYFNIYREQKEMLYCKTWEEYKEKRLLFFDRLYRDIQTNGYKKQINPEDEVSVAISRDGEIFFVDGHHRLTIAKILNVENIPVIVNIWHKQYIDKLKGISSSERINAHQAFSDIIMNQGDNSNPG